jgi:ribosomal protein S18 acetylase RimI-like enzyme
MPRLTDKAEIRALLETDRSWAAYALGDLCPGFFEHTEWFRAPGGAPALALLYRAFGTPVLFTLGDPEALRAVLEEIRGEPQFYLSIRPEALPHIRSHWLVRQEEAMWRMILEPARFRPAPDAEAVRLGPADLPALRQLHADGEPASEAPDFFFPSMLEQGVYFGVFEGEELVAAAGTHLVAPSESVAAIGNVYTRRDCRGQGLSRRVTGAVTAELLRRELRTIALNVSQHNAAAIRVYERLGFARYCAFYEGMAEREMRDASGPGD